MLTDHPAARPWVAPATPVAVERRFTRVAPYAAGGTNSVLLRVAGGATVRAPCSGIVTFRGSVAGSPPTLTVACDGLRSTLRWVRSGRGRGAFVARGEVIGRATGPVIGLSARRADGSYRDPLALIGAQGARRVPPVGAVPARTHRPSGRNTAPLRRAPVHLPASAFVTAGSGTAAGHGLRLGGRALTGPASASAVRPVSRRIDVPLTAAGVLLVVVTAIVSAVAWLRRRRRRSRSGHRAHLVGVRR